MAKQSTKWEWRGKNFASKTELMKHLANRARAELHGVLGPPVTETRGDTQQFHHIHFKIQLSLGSKPSRKPAVAAKPKPNPRRTKKLKTTSRSAADKTVKEYFG